MAHTHIHIDPALPLARQADKGHNRWHPDIAPAVRIASGSTVEMETLDGLDGQITPRWTAADLASIEMGRVHPLTGPVYVDGAQPGDLLAVKIEQILPASRGFTLIMPGFGFLRDLFTTPFLVHWEMADGFARSEQLPGIRIAGAPFMGVMGVAPSHDLLKRIVAREAELAGRGGIVMPPDAVGAVPATEGIAARAVRTIAPHETGGNFDIKQLTAGATLYLPVQVPGALFSVGDAHFAQGDGESCGTAVETSATFVARFEVLKGEATRRRQRDPSYAHGGHAHHGAAGVHGAHGVTPSKGYYATTGMSVRSDGRAESEDITLAARNALVNMIDYIADAYSLTREQAYCIASVAVDLRISQVVDVPNMTVSAVLPLDIFER
ncbi:acetamidase/formamidase family protein [Reyranella sp. CPCC 100927]|uniref:acetamidase/formamidase family protein n=1 Tax=Reyranella sp. CPCC 100927 TaxID=2599616 RepID=UPI0011B378D8|nr:acetamidase/formamidase family protein [Reyranella sp. CPCC 100927]TWT10892.1 acetamidase [Reyranella sp. CPCC 100927]